MSGWIWMEPPHGGQPAQFPDNAAVRRHYERRGWKHCDPPSDDGDIPVEQSKPTKSTAGPRGQRKEK